MFDRIFNAISKVDKLGHFASMMPQIDVAISYFETENMKDPNLRNDAIQALCDYLQTLKTPQGNSHA
jgi:hypothetical protein